MKEVQECDVLEEHWYDATNANSMLTLTEICSLCKWSQYCSKCIYLLNFFRAENEILVASGFQNLRQFLLVKSSDSFKLPEYTVPSGSIALWYNTLFTAGGFKRISKQGTLVQNIG